MDIVCLLVGNSPDIYWDAVYAGSGFYCSLCECVLRRLVSLFFYQCGSCKDEVGGACKCIRTSVQSDGRDGGKVRDLRLYLCVCFLYEFF